MDRQADLLQYEQTHGCITSVHIHIGVKNEEAGKTNEGTSGLSASSFQIISLKF